MFPGTTWEGVMRERAPWRLVSDAIADGQVSSVLDGSIDIARRGSGRAEGPAALKSEKALVGDRGWLLASRAHIGAQKTEGRLQATSGKETRRQAPADVGFCRSCALAKPDPADSPRRLCQCPGGTHRPTPRCVNVDDCMALS